MSNARNAFNKIHNFFKIIVSLVVLFIYLMICIATLPFISFDPFSLLIITFVLGIIGYMFFNVIEEIWKR